MSPSRDQIRSNQATSVLFHYRQGGRPRNLGDEFRRRRARNIPHAQSACSAVTARIGSGETSRQLIEVVEQQRAPVGCHITQWRNELTSRIADRVGKPKRTSRSFALRSASDTFPCRPPYLPAHSRHARFLCTRQLESVCSPIQPPPGLRLGRQRVTSFCHAWGPCRRRKVSRTMPCPSTLRVS